MNWLLFGSAVIVAYLFLNGLRSRCPVCGSHGLHPRDHAKIKEDAERRRYLNGNQVDGSLGQAKRIGTPHKCKSCGHSFRKGGVDAGRDATLDLGDGTRLHQ